ncbi:MAG: hypothetical protein NC421_09805 [Lachnospiraceae bacterium]|nr:hypothetical protein [Lachnospiraceae bacterium]
MVFFSGCGDSLSEKLTTARQIATERPDSAYVILREIDFNAIDIDSLKAKYILTRALTNLRIGRSLITDTLLNDAADYYISIGDTANWTLASQMLSGYDFMRGDTEAAHRRLADMIPRIKSQELLWDTYIHLLEVAINSKRYSDAYDYADWLLTHTNIPDQILRFTTAKGAAQYMQGNFDEAINICDSIISTGIIDRVGRKAAMDFYEEYAEMLDGAGHSSKAIEILDHAYDNTQPLNNVNKVIRRVSLAQFYANTGNTAKAKELLDSINIDGTQSIVEIYATIGMLKAAIEFKESGHFPSELMHQITKNMHLNFQLSQIDRQTAMESVIELSEDKTDLQLQKQRLWLLIFGILLVVIIGGTAIYIILNRRKQRLIDAEERIETLDRMLKEVKHPDKTDKETILKRMVLQQMGIIKRFASTPTAQNEEALRKIADTGLTNNSSNGQLVDWDTLYTLVDELFDGFHDKLIKRYPDFFTDKEIQLICLLQADFSTKEIAFLTGQSSASVYVRKSTIRKKLGTAENGDFMAQIKAEI